MIWNRYRLIKLMRVLWTADLCKLIKHFWANRSMDLYFLVIPYQQRVSPDWLHTTPNICALCLLNGCSLWKQAKCLCQKKRLTWHAHYFSTGFCEQLVFQQNFSSSDISNEIKSRQRTLHVLNYSNGSGSLHHWRIEHDNFAKGCNACSRTAIGM